MTSSGNSTVDPMLMDDRKDIDSRIIFMTEDFDDFPFCTLASLRISGQLHNDLMSFRRTLLGRFRDEDVACKFLIIGDDESEMLAFSERPDHLIDTAFDDADDGPFSS